MHYYAGWERNDPPLQSQVYYIGHPAQVEQKWAPGYLNGPSPDFYKYEIYFPSGFIQGGASGGSVFNQSKRSIGVCSYEIFGPSYFGRMSSAWNIIKPWLSPNQNLQAMDGYDPMLMTGPTQVCSGSSVTISMPRLLASETVSWSTSGNLSIVSSTAHAVTVTPANTGNGPASINAAITTFSRNFTPVVSTASYTINVGPPAAATVAVSNTSVSPASTATNYGTLRVKNDYNSLGIYATSGAPLTGASWSFPPGWYGTGYGTNAQAHPNSNTGTLYIFPANQCGSSSTPVVINTTLSTGGYYGYAVSPNPAGSELSVTFAPDEQQADKTAEPAADQLPEALLPVEEKTGRA